MMVLILSLVSAAFYAAAFAGELKSEPVQACIRVPDVSLNSVVRAQYAQCLGWLPDQSPLCYGAYSPVSIAPLADPDEIRIMAKEVSFYQQGQSLLKGNVEVQEGQRVLSAQTAYVYRDAKTSQVNRIELLGDVRYMEPDRLMIARKAIIYPQDKSGQVEDVLYRFKTGRRGAILPAWGRASLIQRFPDKDYLLKQATYSNCAPQDNAWEIRAESIRLDHAKGRGVARNAVLRIRDVPVLYTPYISFPTNKERKSGFLMPVTGYSNVGGYDLALPYYLNLAPNYDATLIPHMYTRRGVMMGGQFRYLTKQSTGVVEGHFLPQDRAFKNFVRENLLQYPTLKNESFNRWSVGIHDITSWSPNLRSTINFQQVSDDYFLQDFSTNLAVLTERQLIRQADMVYFSEHWKFKAMAQSYQTLNPVNQTPVEGVYERLPQLFAQGLYTDLPLNADFQLLSQYDQFHWPNDSVRLRPEGPRLHLNPILGFPQTQPWGYLTPSVQLVEDYYDVNYNNRKISDQNFNRTIPRYSIDGGLFFERNIQLMGQSYTQTLEPRLFYLYVPYRDQTQIPVYDSAYMIFNTDQLFRTNRFSGYDRVGDANQLSYAVASRWLSEETGNEKASFSIGQIRYFSDRRVQLCQSITGQCTDNPNALGFLSPDSEYSPVAARATYHFSPSWILTGDYVWDPATRATNNGHLNFHYQPAYNHVLRFAYSYLVNGDVSPVADNTFKNTTLHQATFAYAWPFNDHWSSLGAYSYNLSKGYGMMTFLGIQYDSCCWAVRLLGGRTFKNLNSDFRPEYNNNVYLQILLKGLGSVANSDPYSTIHTYIPGYNDQFHR